VDHREPLYRSKQMPMLAIFVVYNHFRDQMEASARYLKWQSYMPEMVRQFEVWLGTIASDYKLATLSPKSTSPTLPIAMWVCIAPSRILWIPGGFVADALDMQSARAG
jgi:hypothetical protein